MSCQSILQWKEQLVGVASLKPQKALVNELAVNGCQSSCSALVSSVYPVQFHMMLHNQYHTQGSSDPSYRTPNSPTIKLQITFKQPKFKFWLLGARFKMLYHILGASISEQLGRGQMQSSRFYCLRVPFCNAEGHLKTCAPAPKNLFLAHCILSKYTLHTKAAFQTVTHQSEFQNQAKNAQLY